MVKKMIDVVMIFAAGLGKRLRPMTQDIPKPLVRIADKPILYYALDFALKFDFKKIIINCHYHYQQIQQAVALYQENLDVKAQIVVLYEPILLETGGAIKNAYPFFQESKAIFTLNSDSIISGGHSVWQSMIARWDPSTMDFLLLLNKVDKSFGSVGNGDFDMNSDGSLRLDQKSRQFIYTGLQILKPDLIKQNTRDIFSLKDYYTNQYNKIHGEVHKGAFYHISNIKDYQEISAIKLDC
jgi:MurNAc alpha-1-phosphate uridylyltransferase